MLLKLRYKTFPMTASTQKVSQPMMNKPILASEDTKCISTRVDKRLPCQRGHEMLLNTSYVKKTFPMIASKQTVSQPVMNKPIHASEDTKYISTSVETTTTQNTSQPVLNKILPMPAR